MQRSFRILPSFFFSMLLCLSGLSQAGALETGKSAFQAHDYSKALNTLTPLAKQGNAEARYLLGQMYEHGYGLPGDGRKAVSLYKQASAGGIADAAQALGQLYYDGRTDVMQDRIKAAHWYQRAIELGDTKIGTLLGFQYLNGDEVKQDFNRAVKWFGIAAAHGEISAQYQLGRMYYIPMGIKKDVAAAAKWWRKAAENGDPSSQFSLAGMYYEGQGVKQDWVLARMLLQISAAKDSTTKDYLKKIDTRLTPEQAAEARSLAEKWHKGMPIPEQSHTWSKTASS